MDRRKAKFFARTKEKLNRLGISKILTKWWKKQLKLMSYSCSLNRNTFMRQVWNKSRHWPITLIKTHLPNLKLTFTPPWQMQLFLKITKVRPITTSFKHSNPTKTLCRWLFNRESPCWTTIPFSKGAAVNWSKPRSIWRPL